MMQRCPRAHGTLYQAFWDNSSNRALKVEYETVASSANEGISPQWPMTHFLVCAFSFAARQMNAPGARGNMLLPGQDWPGRICQYRSIAASSGLTYFVHAAYP